ncbi:MAG: MaoC family dehydratase N-terminal domain-containing protein [Trueperaceae bacterium]
MERSDNRETELLGHEVRTGQTTVCNERLQLFLEALGLSGWDPSGPVPVTFVPRCFRDWVDVTRDVRPGPVLDGFGLEKGVNAGITISAKLPVFVGDRLHLTEKVAEVREKEGASGALIFVTVRQTIRREKEDIGIVQENDMLTVYRRGAEK